MFGHLNTRDNVLILTPLMICKAFQVLPVIIARQTKSQSTTSDLGTLERSFPPAELEYKGDDVRRETKANTRHGSLRLARESVA